MPRHPCLLPHWLRLLLAGSVTILCSPWTSAQDANELKVLPAASNDVTPSRMMYDYLRRQAHDALAQRRERFAEVKTPEQISQWQQMQQEFFIRQLGGLPPRTPLKAEVVGKLKGDGFRGEKILFESQPNVYVSAIIYLPTETKPPYPAVLIPAATMPRERQDSSRR